MKVIAGNTLTDERRNLVFPEVTQNHNPTQTIWPVLSPYSREIIIIVKSIFATVNLLSV